MVRRIVAVRKESRLRESAASRSIARARKHRATRVVNHNVDGDHSRIMNVTNGGNICDDDYGGSSDGSRDDMRTRGLMVLMLVMVITMKVVMARARMLLMVVEASANCDLCGIDL